MKKILFLAWIMLGACSTVKISGVDKSGDFLLSKYSSFNFVDVVVQGDAVSPNSETNLTLLKEAITKQLVQRGLSKTSDNADLMVNIGVVVTEEVQTRETNFANPADRTVYMGQRNYSWKSQEVAVGTYRQGSVTVDLVDRASNTLVWKGTAESVLPKNQKNIAALIEEGMDKLFSKL